ncbi:Thioredoxin [hydrothermal vent metagenome]|uniref:Thioredoxin n=1 Tax=hydrothermal vent metagenome TaxID=652676 RepID=A0A3B1E461_9ZZZZ
MKKIMLVLITITTIVSASWFQTDKKELKNHENQMLKSTPFSQIQPQIGKEPMMIEFGSVSCQSCQVMGKILFKIKQKYPKSNIYFLDIYKDMPTAKSFGIRMIPTQKYLDKDGNIADTHMGIIKQDEFEKKLKNLEIIR